MFGLDLEHSILRATDVDGPRTGALWRARSEIEILRVQ